MVAHPEAMDRGDDEREVTRQKHLVMWFVSFLTLIELDLPPIATQETHEGLYSHSAAAAPAVQMQRERFGVSFEHCKFLCRFY